MVEMFANECGICLDGEHVFSCETVRFKQSWITKNFPTLALLFGDVTKLGRKSAFCCISEMEVEVPYVDLLVAGFCCASASWHNINRSRLLNCVGLGIDLTGETFDGILSYIARHKPKAILLENVPGLVGRNLDEVRSLLTMAG
jgi:site-specific DNA-cytosine methylase